MSYFNFAVGLTMTNKKFDALFGAPARKAESNFGQREMDIARSIQVVTEEIVLKLARTIHKELDVDYLCLAGGVALNCVSNGRLLREGPFKDIWIQPAAGDAGGALGAALSVWHEYLDQPRQVNEKDSMRGSYLGPNYSNDEIKDYLDSMGAKYLQLKDKELLPRLAEILDQGNVVGWFAGRMEFGPRALGGRSIIGDPRNTKMQSVMNLKIKYRESFRPFAPAVKMDKVSEYFEIDRASPYMLLVAPVKENLRIAMTEEEQNLFGIEKLNVPRSKLPAVTHVDYSARIQTVHEETNPFFYRLLDAFEKRTGCPVLVNTSFNVRGEPIVCSPEDTYRCFMRTEMDYLVMENILIVKTDQANWQESDNWKEEFELD
jgi:carbamoyltransferase